MDHARPGAARQVAPRRGRPCHLAWGIPPKRSQATGRSHVLGCGRSHPAAPLHGHLQRSPRLRCPRGGCGGVRSGLVPTPAHAAGLKTADRAAVPGRLLEAAVFQGGFVPWSQCRRMRVSRSSLRICGLCRQRLRRSSRFAALLLRERADEVLELTVVEVLKQEAREGGFSPDGIDTNGEAA